MMIGRILSWPFSAAKAVRQMVGEHRFRTQMLAKYEGLHLGKWVDIRSPDRLKLGRNVTIETGVILHCGGFDWCGYAGGITMGNNCYIGPNSVLFGAGGIEVGDYFSVGPGVVIAAQQVTQYDTPVVENLPKFASIRIGNNVSIATQATILQGVQIGDYSVIGAGSVVTRDVPPHSLAVGLPARVVRQI